MNMTLTKKEKNAKGDYKKTMKQLLRVYLPRESCDSYVLSSLLGGGKRTVNCWRSGRLIFVCDVMRGETNAKNTE